MGRFVALSETGQIWRVDPVVRSQHLGGGYHEATGDAYAVYQNDRKRPSGSEVDRDAGVHRQASDPNPTATQLCASLAYVSLLRPTRLAVPPDAYLTLRSS